MTDEYEQSNVTYPPPRAFTFSDRNRLFAKKLQDAGVFEKAYGFVDGLSNGYSACKYCSDILSTNMHEWLLTPEGAAIAVIASLGVISYSVLGTLFDDKDKSAIKKYIAITWPHFRDTVKALKNAQKGARISFQIASILANTDLRYCIVPTALGIGVAAVANRMWYRRMVTARKDMMKVNGDLLLSLHLVTIHTKMTELPPENARLEYKSSCILINGILYYIDFVGNAIPIRFNNHQINAKLIEAIQNNTTPDAKNSFVSLRLLQSLINTHAENKIDIHPSEENIKYIRDTLKEQRQWANQKKYKSYLSQAFGGTVDGLYLYMGMMGVASLCPPLFIAMVVLSATFTFLCLVARIYEEYDYQRMLRISQKKIELSLIAKELENLLNQLQISNSVEEKVAIDVTFMQKAAEFQQQRDYLYSQRTTHTIMLAILEGIKNGIAAYSALGSMMFAVATIMMLASFPFPPLILVTTILLGAATMLGFVSKSLYNHYSKANQPIYENHLSILMQDSEQNAIPLEQINPQAIKNAIDHDVKIDGSGEDPSQGLQVIRAAFSSVNKAKNASSNFVFAGLQSDDKHGHTGENAITSIFLVLFGAVYAVVLTVREYIKRFARAPADEKINHVDVIDDEILLAAIEPTIIANKSPVQEIIESHAANEEHYRQQLSKNIEGDESSRVTVETTPLNELQNIDELTSKKQEEKPKSALLSQLPSDDNIPGTFIQSQSTAKDVNCGFKPSKQEYSIKKPPDMDQTETSQYSQKAAELKKDKNAENTPMLQSSGIKIGTFFTNVPSSDLQNSPKCLDVPIKKIS